MIAYARRTGLSSTPGSVEVQPSQRYGTVVPGRNLPFEQVALVYFILIRVAYDEAAWRITSTHCSRFVLMQSGAPEGQRR